MAPHRIVLNGDAFSAVTDEVDSPRLFASITHDREIPHLIVEFFPFFAHFAPEFLKQKSVIKIST